jgi:hypothetical protein
MNSIRVIFCDQIDKKLRLFVTSDRKMRQNFFHKFFGNKFISKKDMFSMNNSISKVDRILIRLKIWALISNSYLTKSSSNDKCFSRLIILTVFLEICLKNGSFPIPQSKQLQDFHKKSFRPFFQYNKSLNQNWKHSSRETWVLYIAYMKTSSLHIDKNLRNRFRNS